MPLTNPERASTTNFTPIGGISSKEVQAAIAELDREKEPIGAAQAAINKLLATVDPFPQYKPTTRVFHRLTPLNGWATLGNPITYTKYANGIVSVEGDLSKNSRPNIGEVIAVLPFGFRLLNGNNTRIFYASDNANGSYPFIVTIAASGEILYNNSGNVPPTTPRLLLGTVMFYGGI